MNTRSQHPSFNLLESDRPYLEHIPADFLKLLLLLHHEKMNYREIEQQIGIPAGTVRSRIHRAREIIRHHRAINAPKETRQAPTMAIMAGRAA